MINLFMGVVLKAVQVSWRNKPSSSVKLNMIDEMRCIIPIINKHQIRIESLWLDEARRQRKYVYTWEINVHRDHSQSRMMVSKHIKPKNNGADDWWCNDAAPPIEPLLVDPALRDLPECPFEVAKTSAGTVAVPNFLVTAVVAYVWVPAGSDFP